ncbi:MAG: alpha/beta hydrolase [Nitrospira sp.]|nr:alpha/beta hydrolase [Nitrospira sp.]
MNAFILSLRDQPFGGAVTSGVLYKALPYWDVWWNDRLPDFKLLTRGQRLTVLLHGYNNGLDEGREKLVRFIGCLEQKGSTDLMLAVIWPGDSWANALGNWAGALSYPSESRDADDSADNLLTWLVLHVDESARVAFVGHSLGCRVVMRATQRMARDVTVKKPILDRICLMAAAIDSNSLGKDEPTSYRDAAKQADRIAVLASQEDRVLQVAYRAGDSVQSWWPFSGERSVRALGRYGPEGCPPEVSAKIESHMANPDRGIGHSDYLPLYPPPAAPQHHTRAESEQFVFEFLSRRPNPDWPAERP